MSITIRTGPRTFIIRQNAKRLTLQTGGGGGGGDTLPPLANLSGAVLIEEPVGTLIFRRLRAADIDPDFAISSFSAASATVEVGATVTTPAFTAAYAGTPTSADLTDDEGTPSKDVIGTPTSFASDISIQKTANNDGVQFTLTADDGTGPDVANTSISWRPRTFWGLGVDGLSSEADIEALSNSALDSNRNTSFTLAPGAGEHIYYAFPSSYGTPTFTVDGFPGGFVLEAGAVSVTNALGVTQDYDLWKSVNANLGSVDVVVT